MGGRTGLIVLDTHAWLWLVDDPSRLSAPAAEAIERASEIGVSPISGFEIGLLVAGDRIRLSEGLAEWIAAALAASRAIELALDLQIAARAALLPREEFPGDPADRLIYASARAAGAKLVTADRRLRAFDPRGTVW